jgi:hypothetical protein
MARTGPSAADRKLICQLAARDLSVSATQLERWRRAGLLPRNSRRGCGRGRGSVSEASPEAVEIAAALSRHTRQGRDLRLAVVDWFADAGKPAIPGGPTVPEPPHAAVHAALMWVLSADSAYRLFQRARSARTEAERDDFYDTADTAVRSWPRPAAGFDPAVMREALLAHQDPPHGTVKSGQQVRSGMIQLIAAAGMGYGEVPADLFAEAIADVGLVSGMSDAAAQRVVARLVQLNELPASSLAELLITRYDPLEILSLANAELLQEARTAAWGMAAMGSVHLLHALLMPDTPELAALRADIDGLGIGQWLMRAALDVHSTDGFAFTVVSCLHPFVSAMHKFLAHQAATGPPLLPDNVHDAERFMADWATTLEDTARQRRRGPAAAG